MNDLNIGQEFLFQLVAGKTQEQIIGLPRRRTWHEDSYLKSREQSDLARELVCDFHTHQAESWRSHLWTGIVISAVGIACGVFWMGVLCLIK